MTVLQKYFEAMQQGLASSAHVKNVFGDPVSAEGKTIIPVAKVRYGFGGGMGSGPTRGEGAQPIGEGGGGGGGVMVSPIGVVEISSSGTRFIPICNRKLMAGLLFAGFCLGWWRARR